MKYRKEHGCFLTQDYVDRYLEAFGCTLLGKHLGWPKKILYMCPNGHILKRTFEYFKIRPRSCALCAKEKQLQIKREEIKQLAKKYGYSVNISTYEDSRSVIEFYCENGHVRRCSKHHLKEVPVCPECSALGNRDDFLKFVKKEIYDSGYKLLSEYTSALEKFWLECPEGHQFQTTWASFHGGRRCGICSYAKRSKDMKLSYEFVKEQIELLGFEVLQDYYEGARLPMKLRCSKGHIFYSRYDDIRKNKTCNVCTGKILPFYIINEEVSRRGYEYISKSKGCSGPKLKLKCSCGNVFEIIWGNFYRHGQGCPNCAPTSYGEEAVKSCLENLSVNYIREYTFKDCIRKAALPFDFAVLNDRNEVLGLIEYDGEPHFKAVVIFGGEKELKYRQENDNIKTVYCETNNIPLLRIPYWDKRSIPTIVKKFTVEVLNV